jgi:2-hydroxy-3-oxopropionate reductase
MTSMVRHVAFIGLGVMGAPMAANLVRGGFAVTGFSRSEASTDRLAAMGGRKALTLADAVSGADAVITMLPDSPDVESVMLGDNGVFAHAVKGTLIIDCSTIAPSTAVKLQETAAERGMRMIDAPVSGGESGAIDGSLSIMAGGSDEDVDSARPVLSKMGGRIVHVGGPGSGQLTKAANQLIVGGTLELIAEAIVFLESYDVDISHALEAIQGGLAGSAVLERKGMSMLRREFIPGFRVSLHDKDMRIVVDTAREAGVAIPLGNTVAALMGSLKARGFGDADHSAVVATLELLSGREKRG